MIGIEFKYSFTLDNFISKIFQNINLEDYKFYYRQQEIIFEDTKETKFKKIMNGYEIKNLIENNEKYMIVDLNLHVYYQNNKEILDLSNYDNFLNSNCQLVILIYDLENVEIYFKDNYLKEKILLNLSFLNIKYKIKTLKNDGRTSFYV